MMLLSGTLLVFLCVLFVSWLYLYTKRYDKYLKNIPGPPRLPFLGNALDFRSTKYVLQTLMKYERDYGPVCKVQIGLRQFLLVTDYKLLEFILSSSTIVKKSLDYVFIRPWLGTGLFTSNGGPKYRKHRKIIASAFTYNEFVQFIYIFEREGDKMIEKLKKIENKTSVDIYHFVTLCTLDIICDSAMGVSIKAQENDNNDYVYSVKEMCRIVVDRSISALKMHNFFFKLSKDYKKQQKAISILHGCTEEVIRKKQENSDDNQENRTFLDILTDANDSFTQKELRDEVTSFLFGGHDTVASALSFVLYCIATNPEAQQKAVEEQKQIFGNVKNPEITRTKAQEMKYLEMIIKESLRLYPPASFFLRETDRVVEFGDLTIPAGITIMIFPFAVHRNPDFFPNPEKFDPSRFEKFDQRNSFAFLPFSAGPRNCMGQKYAMLEMKCITSKIIRNFELMPAIPEHKPFLAAELVMKSINGIRIGLKARKEFY